jgi:hypothetical protein
MIACLQALLLFLFSAAALAADVACPPGAALREGEVSGGPAAWCELEEDNSLLHGPFRSWHRTGILGIEEHYVRGKAAGRATYWWGSGKKQAQGNYKDGIRDGWWTFWNKNGINEGKVRFQDGNPVAGRLPKWAEDWDGSPTAPRAVSHP